MSQLTNTPMNTNNRKPKQKKIKMSLAEFHKSILDKIANNQQFTTKEKETYKKRIKLSKNINI